MHFQLSTKIHDCIDHSFGNIWATCERVQRNLLYEEVLSLVKWALLRGSHVIVPIFSSWADPGVAWHGGTEFI